MADEKELPKNIDAAIPTFETLVFFDLETTDLKGPNHLFKMTELSMCAVERSHFLSNIRSKQVPRVTNRLNLCINPTVPFHPKAAEMSKLSSQLLEGQTPFDIDIFDSVKSFIRRLETPVCLVAHKGFEFDFPLLKSEISMIGLSLGEDLYCADSLLFFRSIYPNTANDLISVYKRFHGKKPPVSHAAEADVATLLLATMWIPQQFLNYIQTNAKPFNEVDKCW